MLLGLLSGKIQSKICSGTYFCAVVRFCIVHHRLIPAAVAKREENRTLCRISTTAPKQKPVWFFLEQRYSSKRLCLGRTRVMTSLMLDMYGRFRSGWWMLGNCVSVFIGKVRKRDQYNRFSIFVAHMSVFFSQIPGPNLQCVSSKLNARDKRFIRRHSINQTRVTVHTSSASNTVDYSTVIISISVTAKNYTHA